MGIEPCQVARESFESNVLTIERRGELSSSLFGFFGLHDNPFSISPNPRFLYPTRLTHAASQQLVDAIRNRKGLILLTGEVGTGKTLLLHRVLDWLAHQKMPTALISNSHLKPDHLLDFILSDFGVPCESSLKSEKLISLNRWLLDRYRFGQTPVLIVDEAQGLPLRTLEEIRLLLNLETPRFFQASPSWKKSSKATSCDNSVSALPCVVEPLPSLCRKPKLTFRTICVPQVPNSPFFSLKPPFLFTPTPGESRA